MTIVCKKCKGYGWIETGNWFHWDFEYCSNCIDGNIYTKLSEDKWI